MSIKKNCLLVYPEFPSSYWGFQFALPFFNKKANTPPLGLLTLAGMFPPEYNLRLVDMNVKQLTEEDFQWADIVFTSTMTVQSESLQQVVSQCKAFGVPIVAGGPHPTSYYEYLESIDYLVLGEVEDIFPNILKDLQNGEAKRIYRASKRPELAKTPLPRYNLINLDVYSTMVLQFSRGCPFNCEFCDITKLYGRVPRTKSNEQMLQEFDLLYSLGWRGLLFLVDDNFIGNKFKAMSLLHAITEWQKEHGYPFQLFTEASVNLAEMPNLMDAMIQAGFYMVFLGLETPNPEALLKTKKDQNVNIGEENYLFNAVRKIQQTGIEVTAGFILGLDGDDESAFDSTIQFVQEAGIPAAMVGLLTAVKGTDLYIRLQKEGRLIEESTGDNFAPFLNFEPEIDSNILLKGYARVMSTLYDPSLKNYFERCLKMLRCTPIDKRKIARKISKREIIAFMKSLRHQLLSRQGPAYFRFLARVLIEDSSRLPEAVRLAIAGYHFEKITEITTGNILCEV